jgi:ubiquinone biosynthesis protein
MSAVKTSSPLAHWDLDVASLVPEEYAVYRPVVVDALLFFLRHLSPSRAAAILEEQNRMTPTSSVAKRFAALLRHCPTLHKLGQVVARNRRLSPTLRKRLQTLESMEPTTSLDAVKATVEKELGKSSVGELSLAPRAIAEASVAVVLPFTSRGAEPEEQKSGVLKVLKPDIAARLEEELDVWTRLGEFIDQQCERYRAPPLRYAQTLETVRELLSNEVRLDREQSHLNSAGQFYADVPSVHIPRVLPYCTPRLTAMERVYGTKVTDVGSLNANNRRRVANVVIDALIARPVFSAEPKVMFHADPHAGNLFLTDAGRLAILDWSLVGHLGKSERVKTMQLMLGAMAYDGARIATAVRALARTFPDEEQLRAAVQRSLQRLVPGRLPGFHWLVGLLDDATLSAGVDFTQDLVFLRKSILTIEGVLADVSADSSIDGLLPLAATRQFCSELPQRMLAAPTSRAFGTHVSNLDLLALYWGIPATAARFWTQFWTQSLTDSPQPK